MASLIGLILALMGNSAWAADQAAEISKAFVPTRFNVQEHVQVVVEAVQPNGCYKPGRTQIEVDSDRYEVRLTQLISEVDEICIQVVGYFHKEIDLGILKEGSYKIIDMSSGLAVGEFDVTSQEPLLNKLVPVIEVQTSDSVNSNTTQLKIAGVRPSGCIEINRMISRLDRSDVLVVHPSARIDSAKACTRQVRPFTETITIEVSQPTLIQVKNADGTSINKVIQPVRRY
jgi:hypothetical protein